MAPRGAGSGTRDRFAALPAAVKSKLMAFLQSL